MAEQNPIYRDLERFRGDTKDFVLFLTKDKVVFPLAGFSAILSVSTDKAPVIADYKLQSIAIVDDVVGSLTFPFTPTDVDLVGKHYYDVQLTDAVGKISTILNGILLFKQDITK